MYPSGISNNIGELLRLIQEEKSSSLAAVPPSSEPSSPIRGMVQQPIQTPEAPGSSRVVSIRPEGVTQQGPEATPTVVSPVMPTPVPTPEPVAPRAASSVSAVSQPSPSAPSSVSRPVPTPVPTPTPPSIGTRITSSVKGASVAKTPIGPPGPPAGYYNKTTPKSRIGPPVVKGVGGAIPTPTPVQKALNDLMNFLKGQQNKSRTPYPGYMA